MTRPLVLPVQLASQEKELSVHAPGLVIPYVLNALKAILIVMSMTKAPANLVLHAVQEAGLRQFVLLQVILFAVLVLWAALTVMLMTRARVNCVLHAAVVVGQYPPVYNQVTLYVHLALKVVRTIM
jgi:hypothetical protein